MKIETSINRYPNNNPILSIIPSPITSCGLSKQNNTDKIANQTLPESVPLVEKVYSLDVDYKFG